LKTSFCTNLHWKLIFRFEAIFVVLLKPGARVDMST